MLQTERLMMIQFELIISWKLILLQLLSFPECIYVTVWIWSQGERSLSSWSLGDPDDSNWLDTLGMLSRPHCCQMKAGLLSQNHKWLMNKKNSWASFHSDCPQQPSAFSSQTWNNVRVDIRVMKSLISSEELASLFPSHVQTKIF